MSQCYQRRFCQPCPPCPPCPPCTTTYCCPSTEDCPTRRKCSCCDYFPSQRLLPQMSVVADEVPKKRCNGGSPNGTDKCKRKREDLACNNLNCNPCTAQVYFTSKCPPNAQKKQQSNGSPKTGSMGKPYSSRSKKRDRKHYDTKQNKNKQNYQYQDMLGKNRMEVINEEHENDPDYCFDGADGPAGYKRSKQSFGAESKKMQDSCADFLNIVHDTVLETMQQSVEKVMRDYFMHTMEKIECLCSQMMRNECLLSKMYLDVMDKISSQSERNLRQFKCLCQFLAETHAADDESQSMGAEKTKCRCGCKCEERPEFSKSRRSSKNFMRAQGSDTETRTLSADGSISSCTTPHLHPKPKPKLRAQPSNSSYTEEVRQVAQVITEYGSLPRINLLNSAGLNATRSDVRRNGRKLDENKLISVKSGPSDTDLSLSRA